MTDELPGVSRDKQTAVRVAESRFQQQPGDVIKKKNKQTGDGNNNKDK